MYRQSSGRNHRSKGIKVKNILQICLLLAVCFWLIYQVKHSHDKKKEFDESDVKASLQTAVRDEFVRFGRKDIRPQLEGTITHNENRDEQSDEKKVNGEEAEETKHEEDELEEKEVDGKVDDAIGGGDDETDETEEEKLDAVDGDERETQGVDSEDGHAEINKEGTAEDSNHDGDDKSTHEAREEHYKADDASSAVTHNAQIVTTENVNERAETSNEHHGKTLEEESKESDHEESYRKELEVGSGEEARDGHHPSNVTTGETKVTMSDSNENGSSLNSQVPEGSSGHLTSKITTDFMLENHGRGNLTEGTRLSSNSTGSAGTRDARSLSDNSTASSASENVLISEAGNNTESSLEKNNEVEGEKLDTSDGTDESLGATLSESPEEVQQDVIDISDTSNSMEEKDVRTYLDTLPEIQTEGTDNEDAAAE